MAECVELTWSEQARLVRDGFVVRERWDGGDPEHPDDVGVRVWVAHGWRVADLPRKIQNILNQPEE